MDCSDGQAEPEPDESDEELDVLAGAPEVLGALAALVGVARLSLR